MDSPPLRVGRTVQPGWQRARPDPHSFAYASSTGARPPDGVPRMYFSRQWFTLADEVLEDALYDRQAFSEWAERGKAQVRAIVEHRLNVI